MCGNEKVVPDSLLRFDYLLLDELDFLLESRVVCMGLELRLEVTLVIQAPQYIGQQLAKILRFIRHRLQRVLPACLCLLSILLVGSLTEHRLPTAQDRVEVKLEGAQLVVYASQKMVDKPVNLSLKQADISPVTQVSIDIHVRRHLNMLPEEMVPENGVLSGKFKGVGKQEAGR